MQTLKTKLTLLYCLNCLDIILTYTLLKTGQFYEANSFMVPIVASPLLSIFIKILAPAWLIGYACFSMSIHPPTHLHFCHWSVNSILLLYVAINVLHVVYSMQILL